MTATAEANDTKKTAILVCEENGKAVIRYCTVQEAKEACDKAAANCSGASMFTNEHNWDAEFIMAVTNFKDRVHEARHQLQNDLRLRDALDKHGIARDPKLRTAIKAAFQDYNMATIERALRH